MLEWDPNDPDTVKVHYDVSGWSLDQRAELSEALADGDLAHVWEDEEIVVPEALEAEVDALFERLEQILGPFPVGLDADDPGVEYGLDEWPAPDRQALAQALIQAAIPHRWDGAELVVATESEAEVDVLLDGIEQGTLVVPGADTGAPDGALDTLFSGADRLARDPDDRGGRDELLELVPQLAPPAPPYGMSVATWARIVVAAQSVVALLDDDASSSSDIIGAAQDLRSMVREYVS